MVTVFTSTTCALVLQICFRKDETFSLHIFHYIHLLKSLLLKNNNKINNNRTYKLVRLWMMRMQVLTRALLSNHFL
jgi:hypothetical protein